jgi:hypothetical protein
LATKTTLNAIATAIDVGHTIGGWVTSPKSAATAVTLTAAKAETTSKPTAGSDASGTPAATASRPAPAPARATDKTEDTTPTDGDETVSGSPKPTPTPRRPHPAPTRHRDVYQRYQLGHKSLSRRRAAAPGDDRCLRCEHVGHRHVVIRIWRPPLPRRQRLA